MRILLVSPRQFWPTTGGSKLRDYHVARALGRYGSVTYVFFRDPVAPVPSAADIPFCRRLVPVDPPAMYSPGRVLRGVAGQWPLPVLNYTSSEMKQVIQREVISGEYDVVHLEGVHLAAYAPLIRRLAPGLPIVFNWHNIESEGMRRYAELTTSPLKRVYAGITASRLHRVETDLLRTALGTIVCSERERDSLAAETPGARIAVIENGVDTGYFSVRTERKVRNRIVFVGLMAYHANVDGIVWFTREIWPRLRERMPDKILTIVGANPAPAVLALREEAGVEVTGTVPDVRPWYAEAFAAIVPLRVGAGTRLKILESMAAGVPVISTATGAEGLAVTHEENILIADQEQDWVDALSALRNEARRQELIEAGLQLVRSRYDWDIIGDQVIALYEEWLAQESAATRKTA